MRVMVGRRRVAVAHQRRLAVRRVEGHPRLRRRGRDVVAPRVGRAREAPVVVDGRKGRAAKNSVLTAAQNSLNASGEKLTRACVPRAVNDTGQNQ